jgi:hypothetical protein
MDCLTAAGIIADRLGATVCAGIPSEFLALAVEFAGRPAVLVVGSSHAADRGTAHAVAYRNGATVDCRPPGARLVLSDLEIYAALVMFGDESVAIERAASA